MHRETAERPHLYYFFHYPTREWAYARLYRSNRSRIAFPKWLHYDTHHRSHPALEGRVPAIVSVNHVCGNNS